ncbi:DUF6177 family protein [Micromonospora sp. NPDC049559]|uniref:DUF6177 family protein n=1 Tax=Micromonospora sp. NPDC049559 TaxID=3155923 RepID=UPI0034209467
MTWPVSDLVTDRVRVLLQERPVVALHRGLVDAIVAGTRDGRGVQVVTPDSSRMTVPLRLALVGEESRWVVQDGDRRYFDGLTGERLRWGDGAFVADDDTGAADHGAAVLPGNAEMLPGGAAVLPGDGWDGAHQLWLGVQLHHQRPPAAFGLAVEAACRALTGAAPAGWGTAEPVTERWRPAELSLLAASRGPGATLLTVVGGGERALTGTLEIGGAAGGVVELATLAVGYAAGQRTSRAELSDLADALAREHPLSSLLAVRCAGREDGTCSPYDGGRGEPVGLAVGPGVLDPADLAEALALPGAALIGATRRPTVWYDLAGGWEAYDRLSERLPADLPDPPR